jgi:prepilin-type N-terminal cleavage/methylation domain-containing protein
MKEGFTLLELIIVIVILGILATLGFSQYTKVVEKMRIGEAVVNIGKMRKSAIAYYLENGSFTNITAADLGIGTDLPSSCVSTNYFYYQTDNHDANRVQLDAERCTANGKVPQYQGTSYEVYMNYYGNTGADSGILCWQSGHSVPCPP